jgi:hypothetical protein
MVLGMKCVLPKLPGLLQTVHELSAAVREKRQRTGEGAVDNDDAVAADTGAAYAGAGAGAARVKVYVHCWRGGMRSSSVTWFLRHSSAGAGGPLAMDVRVMRGGYKTFRRWALSRWAPATVSGTKQLPRAGADTVETTGMTASDTAVAVAATAAVAAAAATVTAEEEAAEAAAAAEAVETEAEAAVATAAEDTAPYGPRVCIVGGRTGVGKTRALLALRAAGKQVIDLEGLAAHSGSAFGWVGRPPEQPTSEQFSNLVSCEWAALSPAPAWVFVEDEGPHVGKCSVDPGLFRRMRHAPIVVNVVAPGPVRLQVLVEDYAGEEHRADPAWLPVMIDSVGKGEGPGLTLNPEP